MTDQIGQSFESMEWHDALLLSLNIDRRRPGERDEVVVLVEWIDGRKHKVRFTDCYALEAEMHFGVIAPESILSARCLTNPPKLVDMRQQWKKLGVDLEDLRCFEIITNSTSSEIRIYAKRFELVDPCGDQSADELNSPLA